ncbi:Thioesterase/thiol ester dehydrase-isomerase [Microthyrium microscopicum]|uniref:Thioesterase/thiol ester dehydrase-isomerase n=1 Tax=Microthyrium microscopicum TaxID=703497 RepID=A0A6A6UPR4_9PEZI|nr:Thioesterase/thiol ester dehydrase-isomerase [Microthyrium microscopicum]
MATRQRALRLGQRLKSAHARPFSTSTIRQTDGVFKELTAMRVPTPWIDALRERQSKEKEHGAGATASATGPVKETTLTPKTMSDSFTKVVLPLAQDKFLADGYLNSEGNVRLGALFMDLDALSGVIAYKHTGEGVTTVTASFDRISITHPLKEVCDLELSGQVTHVGKSSMEIGLQVAAAATNGQKSGAILLSCSCTMVSLNPETRKPTAINPLKIETAEEKKIFDEAERNSKKRKELRSKTLRKYTPDADEGKTIHSLWQKQVQWHETTSTHTKPSNVTWMEATKLHSAAIMQPQYRNRHHFMIFGGFLLRASYELAFCCAASFAHARPRFVSLDPSTFETPVPVGSVLYLGATVVYTDPEVEGGLSDNDGSGATAGGKEAQKTRVIVRVDSYVRNVEHGERKPTGTFNYSFEVDGDVRVMPRTYGEFMLFIDAKRRSKTLSDLESDVQSATE